MFAVGSTTSCKKNWTCECSTANGTDSASFELQALRKNDAKAKCNEYGNYIGQCTIHEQQ